MRSARRSASSRLLRDAGYDKPIYIHGALAKLCDSIRARASTSARSSRQRVDSGGKHDFAGAIVIGPPSAFADRWARRFPDPISCFASGWMRIRQRAKQGGVELPLIISDHADWDELTATIKRDGRRGDLGDAWPRGGAGALVRAGRHRRRGRCISWAMRTRAIDGMNRFAALLDRLVLTPSRNGKLRLLVDYFRSAADPDRG